MRRARRRSFVLVAVLVITGSALFVVTGVLFRAQADLAGRAGARDRVQSRLLAWSAAQAVMSRLDEQRDRILDGRAPRLDREYVLYEDGDREGVVRLLPVTPAGAVLSAEAGRIDLNVIEGDALAATGLVDEALAQRIVDHRRAALGGSFQSVAELLGVPGMTPERLYGPLEDLDLSDRAGRAASSADARGLADVTTVYGFEPALQSNGRLRINLNVPWSDELARRVDERFGPGAGETLRGIFEAGTRFESEASIFQTLRTMGVAQEDWPEIVDALTTESGRYHFGRLDINTAPREALVTLDGIDEEQAARIVRARDALGSDERATIVWPLLEGIVEAEAYDALAGHITTRSWTYRVRLVAGERGADDEALVDPVILEVVIDLSAPAPRIAYLRDITLLETAARLADAAPEEPDAREDEERASPGEAAEEPAEEPPPAAPRRERVGRWRKGRS